MKCVCPMGGERTCPEDCPLALWATLAPGDRKAQRKPIAERLYNQGFTMEQIGTQLGVHQATITRDLAGLCTVHKPVRAKGGRPKGSAPRRVKVTDPYKEAIIAASDAGHSAPKIAADIGINARVINRLIQDEHIRRQAHAEPAIDRALLSMSAQGKLDAAIRQHKQKLEQSFERRVQEEIKKRVDEMVLPAWKKQIAEARAIYSRRKGILKSKRDFNLIRSCLHTDSRRSVTDKKLDEAFHLFSSLEKALLDETQSPTEVGKGLPGSMAEWDRMRAQAAAERRARRNSGRSEVRMRS